jgi:hypothetical protein
MPKPDLPTSAVVDSPEEIWGLPRQPAGCPNCKQVHLVEAIQIGGICPHCVRDKLEAQPALLRLEPPEHLIPFNVSKEELYSTLKKFTDIVWIRPDDFNPEALFKRLMPVFWPEWLVDSQVVGYWSAEMGYDYQVKSSEEIFSAGQWQTREVVETRVRWEARAGQIQRSYNNIRVPGMEDNQQLTQMVGSYPINPSVPYHPNKIGQAALRVPDLSPESAWPLAQAKLDQAAGKDCAQAAAAQHLRNFNLRAGYESVNWTQLLLPVYVTYYTDDEGQAHAVYINGQTGAAGGVRLASQRKGWIWTGISLVIAAVLFLLGLISFVTSPMAAPLGILGVLLVLFGLGMAVFAILPAIWPWRWNRGQLMPQATPSTSAKEIANKRM